MENHVLIFIANAFLITTLLIMTLLLCFAARFKGYSSYAAIFIFLITLPDFIYNTCDTFNWYNTALWVAPVAYSVDLLLMPLMLHLARRTFNPKYKFKFVEMLHFLPAIAFCALVAIHVCTLSGEEARNFVVIESATESNATLSIINLIMIVVQLIVYFYLIFTYLRKVRKYVSSNLSHAGFLRSVWVPRFITFVGILIILSIIGGHFNPLKGLRLYYFANTIAMGYLLYHALNRAFTANNQPVIQQIDITAMEADFLVSEEEAKSNTETRPATKENMEQLQQYAKEIEKYLQSSQAFINPNLSLKEVATAMGASARNLSKAINIVLGKNFFNLINGYRIEKSKDLLLSKKEKNLTLDSIAEMCGFNSRFTFNTAFKKSTGLTTSKWLNMQQRP